MTLVLDPTEKAENEKYNVSTFGPLNRTKGRAHNIKFNFSFKDTCGKVKVQQYLKTLSVIF